MKYLFTALLMCAAGIAFAGLIKGKVTDDKGETLPYATIYIKGTTIGVSANGLGDYELPVGPGNYEVICQYIGFSKQTFNTLIKGDETINHSFSLKDESTEMNVVVIHASSEDPAYGYIRNAIKKRKVHLAQLRSFQASIYFKGVMRSRKLPEKVLGQKVNSPELGVDSLGRGVLYLTEEDADYYSDGEKEKTIIHSVHESGDRNGVGFSQFPSVITFYTNNVDIFGKNSRGFISPISDNALLYYKYKLVGTFDEAGHTVHKIKVTPRRLYEPCFSGILYLVDGDWAIHSLNLTLYKQSGMNIADTLTVEQVLLPIRPDTWVIKSQVIYFTVKFLQFDITANGVAVYNNQRLNEAIPDSVFAGKVTSQYDKGANKVDSTHWVNRPVPLEADEVRDYVVKDSFSVVTEKPEYRDSIRRRQNRIKPFKLLLRESSYSTREYKNKFTVNPLLLGIGTDNIVNYNTVEGLNFAPKLGIEHTIDTGKTLSVDVAPRYGLSNEHFNAIGRMSYTVTDPAWLNRSWMLGVEGGKYVFQFNPDNPVIPMFNTYRTLLAGENDLKIYERWEATAFVKRNYGNGLTWLLKASWQRRMPMYNTTDYTFAKTSEQQFTPNNPATLIATATAWEQHDAALVYGTVSYKPGMTYTQYPDHKSANGSTWPRFTVTYQKGLPGVLNSRSDFDKWRFSVAHNLPLRLVGYLRYNIAAGGFLNTRYVSLPDLMHIDGIRGMGIAAPYLRSFQFAPYYDFSNKDRLYTEAHLEYHLNGFLTNKIPLLRQARYFMVVGGNAFYTSEKSYYTEAFVGLENVGWALFRFFRVDFVQSWDSRMGRNSGIRVGINFPGLSTARNSTTDSEW